MARLICQLPNSKTFELDPRAAGLKYTERHVCGSTAATQQKPLLKLDHPSRTNVSPKGGALHPSMRPCTPLPHRRTCR